MEDMNDMGKPYVLKRVERQKQPDGSVKRVPYYYMHGDSGGSWHYEARFAHRFLTLHEAVETMGDLLSAFPQHYKDKLHPVSLVPKASAPTQPGVAEPSLQQRLSKLMPRWRIMVNEVTGDDGKRYAQAGAYHEVMHEIEEQAEHATAEEALCKVMESIIQQRRPYKFTDAFVASVQALLDEAKKGAPAAVKAPSAPEPSLQTRLARAMPDWRVLVAAHGDSYTASADDWDRSSYPSAAERRNEDEAVFELMRNIVDMPDHRLPGGKRLAVVRLYDEVKPRFAHLLKETP